MEARYQYETSPRKIQQYEKNDRKNDKKLILGNRGKSKKTFESDFD